jgi:hypothetical protein
MDDRETIAANGDACCTDGGGACCLSRSLSGPLCNPSVVLALEVCMAFRNLILALADTYRVVLPNSPRTTARAHLRGGWRSRTPTGDSVAASADSCVAVDGSRVEPATSLAGTWNRACRRRGPSGPASAFHTSEIGP